MVIVVVDARRLSEGLVTGGGRPAAPRAARVARSEHADAPGCPPRVGATPPSAACPPRRRARAPGRGTAGCPPRRPRRRSPRGRSRAASGPARADSGCRATRRAARPPRAGSPRRRRRTARPRRPPARRGRRRPSRGGPGRRREQVSWPTASTASWRLCQPTACSTAVRHSAPACAPSRPAAGRAPLQRGERGGGGEIGPHVGPGNGAPRSAPRQVALAPVEARQAGSHPLVQRRLPRQQHLRVEHRALGAGHHARRGRAAPHAALHPHRHVQRAAQPLQQHDVLPPPTQPGTCVSLSHDPVHAGGLAGERVLEARGDQEGACAVCARQRHVPRDVAPARAAEQHDVRRPCRRLEREPEQLLVVGDPARRTVPARARPARATGCSSAAGRSHGNCRSSTPSAPARLAAIGPLCVWLAARREHREVERAEELCE